MCLPARPTSAGLGVDTASTRKKKGSPVGLPLEISVTSLLFDCHRDALAQTRLFKSSMLAVTNLQYQRRLTGR